VVGFVDHLVSDSATFLAQVLDRVDRNAHMANRYIDHNMEYVLLKEVALSHAQARPPQLSVELAGHTAGCASCRRNSPEWLERLAVCKAPARSGT
jgi:hypothetical protein